ncbi:hypothetical protein BDP81DRAFT_123448 [Colletotrichum phormii]|uniref:Uncharacterized protein n=1 Tax=Colletotrichum phormii TaxID=359342 RepID=A0AAI9ZYZ3_9PEZI|nr:uncharacterized protein BDP81DRAFT_123448 [Colletotrichum phormii]KAK1640827.1 hypothetical protein BDP81DRAFT_123448 [Colletotrichum phormii]
MSLMIPSAHQQMSPWPVLPVFVRETGSLPYLPTSSTGHPMDRDPAAADSRSHALCLGPETASLFQVNETDVARPPPTLRLPQSLHGLADWLDSALPFLRSPDPGPEPQTAYRRRRLNGSKRAVGTSLSPDFDHSDRRCVRSQLRLFFTNPIHHEVSLHLHASRPQLTGDNR